VNNGLLRSVLISRSFSLPIFFTMPMHDIYDNLYYVKLT